MALDENLQIASFAVLWLQYLTPEFARFPQAIIHGAGQPKKLPDPSII
jgi:hypothetical protein